jgi:eukaryotic-like serine/threonine-protein kinase
MSEPAPDSAPESSSTLRLFRQASTHPSHGASLSPDLEDAAARRLGALALLTAMVAGALMVVDRVVRPPSFVDPGVRFAAQALAVLLSLTLYALIVSGRVRSNRILALAFVYQVAQGYLMGVGFYSTQLAPGVAVRGWSSVAVWMMVFPLVVPSPPGRTVTATLATALMDPLAVWTAVALGAPRPAAFDAAQMFVPTIIACFLAPLAAKIVYGLTVEVKRAREMGSYHLVGKIGEGGMGEVWRAEHRMLARGAAIKLIHPEMLGSGDALRAREVMKRFEREAQATAALRSPHTIEVYDYGLTADGTFYYVMELLEGHTLEALVERFGPLPAERVVFILRQACHSLAEAHAAGLVHRDVKPSNMFTCRLGLDVDVVKVLDFGLVKMGGPQARAAQALTVEGTLAGTPDYMPPEVALGSGPVDGRADIYALGCVAYWLLTGQPVFEGDNAMQVVIDHVRTAPVPPSRRTGQPIPDALERLVLRCLEKDPARRPPSAVALSNELQALGLESAWTEERAQAWWAEHPAGALAEVPRGDAAKKDLSSRKTRSVTPKDRVPA